VNGSVLNEYYLYDQIKEDEVDETCTNESDDQFIYTFSR